MASNFLYGLPPYLTTPSLINVGSQNTDFPATNILNYLRPELYWRTLGAGGQSAEVDFSTTVSLQGIFIANTNLTQIQIQRRSTGATAQICSPNLLTVNEQLLNTAGSALQSPWVQWTPSITVNGFAGAGPYRRILGQQVTFGTAPNGVMQPMTILGPSNSVANRTYSGHVWLRLPAGTAAGTIGIEITDSAQGTVASVGVEVTQDWQRIPFTLSLGGGATGTTIRLRIMRRTSADLNTVIFGGAQVTADATTPLVLDYTTGTTIGSVQIPKNPRTGRRSILFQLPSLATQTLILNILASSIDGAPKQTTAIEVGTVIFLPSVNLFAGFHQFPFTVVVDELVSVATPPSGLRRIRAFDRRGTVNFGGQYIAAQDYTALQSIAQMGLTEPFVFCEGWREGGSHNQTTDPSLAMLVRLQSDMVFRHDIPEVVNASFAFEEVL